MVKCKNCGKEATKFLKGAGSEVDPFCQKCYSEVVKKRGIFAIIFIALVFAGVLIWTLST